MSEPNGTISYRLQRIEQDINKLFALEPAVVARRVNDLHEDIEELKREVKGVTRALWGFGLSIAGAAIVFALTAFQLWA